MIGKIRDATGSLLAELRQERATCCVTDSFEYFSKDRFIVMLNHTVECNSESSIVNQKVEYNGIRDREDAYWLNVLDALSTVNVKYIGMCQK